MKILAIETVTKVGSLAVSENGKILGEITIDTTLNHASMLISELDHLLVSINIDINDIDVIAVDTGPGSFTGIRVGISSAKGLAVSRNKRLVGVCSLDVLCYSVMDQGILQDHTRYLIPFIDAKRGGVYAGLYKITDGGIEVIKTAYLTKMDELLSKLPKNRYIFGPDIDMLKKEEKPVFPKAEKAAIIAWRKIEKGLIDNEVEPMYVYDVEYKTR